ncbi:hypothetical protein C8Q75DRAFT_803447 [Abortiporus biennis]|nr:hypothetical protein C8Q75DRAFT_803447 [Abortiporus biennis]
MAISRKLEPKKKRSLKNLWGLKESSQGVKPPIPHIQNVVPQSPSPTPPYISSASTRSILATNMSVSSSSPLAVNHDRDSYATLATNGAGAWSDASRMVDGRGYSLSKSPGSSSTFPGIIRTSSPSSVAVGPEPNARSASPEPSIQDDHNEESKEPVEEIITSGLYAEIDARAHPKPRRRLSRWIPGNGDESTMSARRRDERGLSPEKNEVPSSLAIEAVESSVKYISDDVPWLMKCLDEVAKLHPAVLAAVLAFKVVLSMELTRQWNDCRIRALYVEMKNMVMILVQLKDVKDHPEYIAGQKFEAYLQEISKKTAKDIKKCGNVCDAYLRTSLVVKFLKAESWKSKLLEFVEIFDDRRREFQMAVSIHTAKGVDDMHDTLKSIEQK